MFSVALSCQVAAKKWAVNPCKKKVKTKVQLPWMDGWYSKGVAVKAAPFVVDERYELEKSS